MIRLNSIAVAPDSTVWIAGGGSILSFDGENWTIHDDNIPAGNWEHITVTRDGAVWACGLNAGALEYRNGSWMHWTTANSPLVSNEVRAVYADQQNNLWLALGKSGITRKTGSDWTYTDMDSLVSSSFEFNQFYADTSGKMWITSNMGVVLYEDGRFINTQSFYNGGNICAVVVDANSVVWLMQKLIGLHRYENWNYNFYPVANLLPSQPKKLISQPDNEKLMIANWGGIIHFKEKATSASKTLIKQDLFSIYPAIVSNECIVECKKEHLDICILDHKGVVVRKLTLRMGENSVDVSSLNPGVYYLMGKDANGLSRRFIKVR